VGSFAVAIAAILVLIGEFFESKKTTEVCTDSLHRTTNSDLSEG